MVAAGPLLLTAGCTSTVDGVVANVGDAAGQARQAFADRPGRACRGRRTASDVVRTRMYVVQAADADAVGRVHGEIFGEVRPVSTVVVVAGLFTPITWSRSRWRRT